MWMSSCAAMRQAVSLTWWGSLERLAQHTRSGESEVEVHVGVCAGGMLGVAGQGFAPGLQGPEGFQGTKCGFHTPLFDVSTGMS